MSDRPRPTVEDLLKGEMPDGSLPDLISRHLDHRWDKPIPGGRKDRNEAELRYLVGPGVSAAALWTLREALDAEGFDKVKIVASSGFGPAKCRVMAVAQAPIDVVGTGSYLPEVWPETYATADIVAYNGEPRVKVGREFLLKKD